VVLALEREEAPQETPNDSEQLKIDLYDDLSEEMVERDLTLCELLNEDV
jgi:hypothetical protein